MNRFLLLSHEPCPPQCVTEAGLSSDSDFAEQFSRSSQGLGFAVKQDADERDQHLLWETHGCIRLTHREIDEELHGGARVDLKQPHYTLEGLY